MYVCVFFFFNDTATTEIYTLSLHDALPISGTVHLPGRIVVHGGRDLDAGVGEEAAEKVGARCVVCGVRHTSGTTSQPLDRKSTRLNSSHANISYAVFCLKKKKKSQTRALIQ